MDKLGVSLSADVGADGIENLDQLRGVADFPCVACRDVCVDLLEPMDDEVVLDRVPFSLLFAPGLNGRGNDVLFTLGLRLHNLLHVLLQYLHLVIGNPDGDGVFVGLDLDVLQVAVQFRHSLVEG